MLKRLTSDIIFKYILTTVAIVVPLVCGGIVLALISNSISAFSQRSEERR